MSVAQLKNIESRLSVCENKVKNVQTPFTQQVQVYDDSMLVSRISLLENKIESLKKIIDEKNKQLKEHCNSIRVELENVKCNCNGHCDNDVEEVQDKQKPSKTTRSKKSK
jgi:hypothetical protein